MFREIFLFDLKQNFKKPATFIYYLIFFSLTLLLGLFASGVFNVASGDSNIKANSANTVADIIVSLSDGILGLVNSIILVAIVATGIQKDYEFNTHPLYFTKPISKANYFFGRFFSSFLTALFVFSAQVTGYYIGCLFGMGKPQMAPFEMMNFLEPFLLFVVPNVLLLGIIFFSITTFTRSTLTAYLFCIILLVIRMVTASVSADLDNKFTAAVWEPFGSQALGLLTEYWTPEEQNTKMIPLEGALLYNRILWLCIGIAVTIISFWRFSFSQFLVPFSLFKKKNSAEKINEISPIGSLASLPKATQHFSAKQTWKQLLYLAGFEFKKMTQSSFFIILCALGIVLMFITSHYMGSMYDTETYPVTYQILGSISGIFQFFMLILIVFFAGNIVWRDREQKTDELIGTTPVSNSVLFFSKYLGLIFVTLLLFVIIIIAGMLIQISFSYYKLEPLEYIQNLFGFRAISYIIIIGLCLFIQTILPNKYLGFFVSLLPILFISIIFSLMEWDNNLYIFNSNGPSMVYSDMNGFGHILGSFILFKTYWLAIVMSLCLIGLTVFARGKEKGLKARFRLSKYSFDGKMKFILAICMLVSIGCGAAIYYNIKVLNKFETPKEAEMLSVDFEKTYKRYQKIPQPRIVSVAVNVDIFASKRSVSVKGVYVLKNKLSKGIDTLVINYIGGEKSDYHFNKLQPSSPATVVIDDKKFGLKIFKLNKTLAPGDSIAFDFEMQYIPLGFANDGTNTAIVYNGTFFNNALFPSIGYDANSELSSNKARKKYGLAEKPRMAAVNDSAALMNNDISHDADWIRFSTTISSDENQIAIAPGYLQKEWKQNGRKYFEYKMDSPILNFYSFLSADYLIKKEKWNDVNIEIYYHKGHEYNLERMAKSLKKSLDYYTKNFGPYQHRQIRILEFPRYQSFAQSFPNTIPYSESIGFIAKVDDAKKEKIDVPFYVTAHEVAHQWWGHQATSGDVQGSALISETMSQYAALMVMEKEYGKQAMKKFLKYEMDKYLQGRAFEGKKELPLMLCENQSYIHYNKGSVVMYALRDYLGEEVLNKALSSYLQKVKFQEPPYTNSLEFVSFIRAATPDSLQYIIKDMFETITVYENYTKDLSYTKTADGKYKVVLKVVSVKFRADSLGKSKKIPVADYMDVGIFAAAESKNAVPKELLLKRIKMDQAEKTFEFIVNEKPVSAGIDPYNKLIDRTPDNNTWKFGSTPPKVDTEINDGKISLGFATEE